MNRHLTAFAKPYRDSAIPFLIVEPVTDGAGAMVDLTCSYANAPAAHLLGLPEDASGVKFSRYLSPAELAAFTPLSTVAFSGSSAAVDYTTINGQPLTFIAYQLLYGAVGCILDAPTEKVSQPAVMPPKAQSGCDAVLELLRGRSRCLSFTDRLEELTGWSRRELYQRCGEDFTAIAAPEDRAALLQLLRDASRVQTAVSLELRLACRDGSVRWALLSLSAWQGERKNIFLVHLTDIHPYRMEIERLRGEQS